LKYKNEIEKHLKKTKPDIVVVAKVSKSPSFFGIVSFFVLKNEKSCDGKVTMKNTEAKKQS
jgi:hypothetical protein